MLVLDLGVFHRQAKEIHVKEALLWTAFWVSLAFCFIPVVYLLYKNHWFGVGTVMDPVNKEFLSPAKACVMFLSGYLMEESLSLDNVFVIAVVFSFFGVPGKYQHRTLFWGILGAVVLRGLMIFVGAHLVATFSWINYVFGAILLFTAYKLAHTGDEEIDLEKNVILRVARRLIPLSQQMHGEKFFVREAGRLVATPLILVLLIVESMDVVFAVDSIPAIFGITGDPFLVFTSNIFAILGLRSLYFALAALIKLFRCLKYSLVVLLSYLGLKMLLSHWTHEIEHMHLISLGVIVLCLVGGVVASIITKEKEEPSGAAEPEQDTVVASVNDKN